MPKNPSHTILLDFHIKIFQAGKGACYFFLRRRSWIQSTRCTLSSSTSTTPHTYSKRGLSNSHPEHQNDSRRETAAHPSVPPSFHAQIIDIKYPMAKSMNSNEEQKAFPSSSGPCTSRAGVLRRMWACRASCLSRHGVFSRLQHVCEIVSTISPQSVSTCMSVIQL